MGSIDCPLQNAEEKRRREKTALLSKFEAAKSVRSWEQRERHRSQPREVEQKRRDVGEKQSGKGAGR